MENTTNTLGEKLLQIQQEIAGIKKSANNPHFRSQYADLNSVLDAVKPQLHKHGLYLLQPTGKDQYGHYVETRIVDTAGNGINSLMYLEGTDNMQKLGAAVSYGRRYTLVSLLGLETEDDDGETAVGRGPTPSGKGPVAPTQYVPKTAVSLAAATRAAKAADPQPAIDDLKNTLNLITAKFRVAVAKKKTTKEDVVAHLQKTYSVDTKDKLTITQAKEFLGYLEGVIA